MPTPHFPVTEFLSSGEPLAVVSPDQAEVAAAGARTADWTVLLAESADGSGLRALQAGLAESLDLPGAAAVNLDALVDALRDLPDRTPDAPGTLLVWTPAEGIGLDFVDGSLGIPWDDVVAWSLGRDEHGTEVLTLEARDGSGGDIPLSLFKNAERLRSLVLAHLPERLRLPEEG